MTIPSSADRRACVLAVAAGVCSGLVFSPALGASSNEAARIRVFESSLCPAVSVAGEPVERWTLDERMAHWKVPGLSIAVIRDGKIAWAKGYGVLQAGGKERVDAQTVFSVGSLSKVGAAALTLRLVDARQLDLDRNVNVYLTRWKLTENIYSAVRPVTLRGILSHSAGLNVHGFPNYQPGDALPTVTDTLEGRAPTRTEALRAVYVPGSRFQYSGGGTTIEQLIVEEVTGLDFQQAARQYVLKPLGMERSTYQNPLPETHGNIAKAHGPDGQPRALPRGYETMPEMAAAGLWATPSDYAKLLSALIESYRGKPDSFLSASLVRQMMTEVGRSPVGLGPFLQGAGLERRFYHGGANDSYRAWMEGHLGTGNGVVVFMNSANGYNLLPEVMRAAAAAEGWSAALDYRVEVPAFESAPATLEERVGTYLVQPFANTSDFRHRSSAVAYRIVRKEDGLYMSERSDQDGRRLVPIDPSRFVTEDESIVEFVTDYSGAVSGLMLRGYGGYVIEARKQ